jgi:hypothetical protein
VSSVQGHRGAYQGGVFKGGGVSGVKKKPGAIVFRGCY